MTSFSPDDIDNFACKLFDYLVDNMDCPFDEDVDFGMIMDFCHRNLDKFCTRDRNYN